MPRGGARPGAGAKPLPVEQHRVAVTVRLPPASASRLRALGELTGESQADLVHAALRDYDATAILDAWRAAARSDVDRRARHGNVTGADEDRDHDRTGHRALRAHTPEALEDAAWDAYSEAYAEAVAETR
jgi:hypothetical protein